MQRIRKEYKEIGEVIDYGLETYPYALLYCMSELRLNKCELLRDIKRDEVMEARFFGIEGELHFYIEDGKNIGVEIADQEDEDSMIENIPVLDNKKGLGKYIQVKRYIDYDSDGQAFVAQTRLYDRGE